MLGRLYNAATGGGASHVPPSQKIAITDLPSAARAIDLLLAELEAASRTPRRPSGQPASTLSPAEYKGQMLAKAVMVAELAKSILTDLNQPPSGGNATLRHTLTSKGQQVFPLPANHASIPPRSHIFFQLMSCLSVVANYAQNARNVNGVAEQAMAIMEASKKLAAAVAKLMNAAVTVTAADGIVSSPSLRSPSHPYCSRF